MKNGSFFTKPLSLLLGILLTLVWIAAAVVIWIFAPAKTLVLLRILAVVIVLLGAGYTLLSLTAWTGKITVKDGKVTRTAVFKKPESAEIAGLSYVYYLSDKSGKIAAIVLSPKQIAPRALEAAAKNDSAVFAFPIAKESLVLANLTDNQKELLEKRKKFL